MTKKKLTPLEQLRNLCDGLAEDALVDDKPLTKQERQEAAELRERLIKFAENHVARLEREAGEAVGANTRKALSPQKKLANVYDSLAEDVAAGYIDTDKATNQRASRLAREVLAEKDWSEKAKRDNPKKRSR